MLALEGKVTMSTSMLALSPYGLDLVRHGTVGYTLYVVSLAVFMFWLTEGALDEGQP